LSNERLGRYQYSVYFSVFFKVGIAIGIGILKYCAISVWVLVFFPTITVRHVLKNLAQWIELD